MKASNSVFQSICFAKPDLSLMEIKSISDTVKSGWIAHGPNVAKFEKAISDLCRVDHAVALDSCTAALELALRALDIGPGDEVITTPYTYSATAEVIRNVGANIVFVDLDGKSFEMDYRKLEDSINERTKAVIPVDIGGKPCDYPALYRAIFSKKDVFKVNERNDVQKALKRVAIVEDAAHSFMASGYGNKVGQIADFTCFSFHVLKSITTGGEGGALVWKDFREYVNNEELENKIRLLADHGQTSRDKSKGWEYDIALFGYNSIMTDIDAAMGLSQLQRIDSILSKRIEITAIYEKLFHESGCVTPLINHFGSGYTSAMHLYPIRLPCTKGREEEQRNDIFNKLKVLGVPCNVHYKPLPMMTAYKNIGFDISDFPKAYEMYSTLLTIPYHTNLTSEQQKYIVDCIEQVVKEVCRD